MITIKKISKLMLIAAFMCICHISFAQAQLKPEYYSGQAAGLAQGNINSTTDWKKVGGTGAVSSILAEREAKRNANTYNSLAECQKNCTQSGHKCVDDTIVASSGTYTCVDYSKDDATEAATQAPAGGNSAQSDSAITGCSSNYGLFSGLIKTGSDIFNKLRDLIYVVAGFGIIGVAVGGFFGNLNWKWLGAIVIALVVIATTGELIDLITGCENFTQKKITNTLK